MPLFSFLSGYVYAWRPYDGQSAAFLGGKARRLLVPVLTVGTAFAVLQAWVPGTNGRVPDWRLLHIVPVSQFWFLQSLFCIFVLVWMLERQALLKTPIGFAAVFACSVVLHLANPLPDHFGLAGMTYLLPHFMAGLWVQRFGDPWLRKASLSAWGAMMVGLLLWAGLQGVPALVRNSSLALLLGIGSCLFLLRTGWQCSGLAWIGVHSFPIFLFNSMCSAASRIGLQRGFGDDVPTVVLLVCGVACGVFGSMTLEFLIRRGPRWALLLIGESPGADVPRRVSRWPRPAQEVSRGDPAARAQEQSS